jgi:Protein of unknown function (DUF1572)
MANDYLESIKKQFASYKMPGEKTFAQVPDDKLFWQYNQDSNSIAIIVKHLWGNMLSRWTNFLSSDGEKEWRNRDAEFDNDMETRQEVLDKWNSGWDCLFNALNSLTPHDLQKEIYIRNRGHTVTEARNRQLAHYAYHTGQIVFIGKMICSDTWASLSVPKGKSKEFNAEKFSIPKHTEHFTNGFLDKQND